MNSTHDKLKLLREAYALVLPEKIAEIEALWTLVKNNQQMETLTTLIRTIHSLYGTSGTYGFQSISKLARHLEAKVNVFAENGSQSALSHEIDSLLLDLKQITLNLPEQETTPFYDFELRNSNSIPIIYFLIDNPQHIKEQLNQFELDYKITFFITATEAFVAVTNVKPDIMVIDISLVSNIPFDTIKKLHEEAITIIYIAEVDDLDSRLFTVRHGGQALMVKPLESSSLIRTIDSLFEARREHNEKVMIVDDSEFLANYYATILEACGMTAVKVTNPKKFLATLQEFQPDIILMDINMPYCNGAELAQIVHQQESLSSIPIIFLSAIAERSKQLELLSLAGDDFLTKPVQPKHLLATVRNRLLRSRFVRTHLMRDSLTNLYNHTMIHHLLDRELAVANRYNNKVSICLIDIDNFKALNDKYGHQAGDKILRELSTFLQRNLRHSDMIGRYGGEEFLIILPNTDGKLALEIMENLGKKFGEITHHMDNQSINIYFSGGVADYPHIKNSRNLIKAADDALYLAKEQGRNKIILSSKSLAE